MTLGRRYLHQRIRKCQRVIQLPRHDLLVGRKSAGFITAHSLSQIVYFLYLVILCCVSCSQMCRLYLRQRKYANAAEQFYYHITSFSSAEGLPEVSFRHYAWLAQQYVYITMSVRLCSSVFDFWCTIGCELPYVKKREFLIPHVLVCRRFSRSVLPRQHCCSCMLACHYLVCTKCSKVAVWFHAFFLSPKSLPEPSRLKVHVRSLIL